MAASACLGGAALGTERLRAIDAGAVHPAEAGLVEVRGFATAVPRRARGTVSVRVHTADGRLLVRAPEPVPEIPVGREIEASGTLAEPAEWERGYLRTHGIHAVVEARRIALTGVRRGGAAALMDGVRDRAEAALERGMPAAEAALARGFVLGQDDRIDAGTVEEFKRSGLAHLLAVSGQNVVLLGLLAVPLLAALGVSLRARLICILVLIAIYVPVTGAGPSIQRAGVMGAAAIVAGLAGTPRSRWYALGLAAFATLAVNPRASADVGWQLSFAAVAGILLWAAPIRAALLARRRAPEAKPTPLRRALADGASLTIAATLATAPLMAHHFESLSVAALPANMLALPAVAPVMWLGMLTAMAGQVPAIPVEPLNAVNALLIGYVAWVAHVLGSPGWAQTGVHLSAAGAAAAYAALLAAGRLGTIASARREGLGMRGRPVAVAGCVAALALIGVAGAGGSPSRPAPPPELEVSVLDVGQGDAILFEPAGEDAVLVDGGPPGAGIAEQLRAEGVERLGLAVLSHDSLDHAAGVREALAAVPVGALAHANASPQTLAAARGAGARVIRVAAGRVLRAGPLRLEVLWPPPELVERPRDLPSASEAEASEAEDLNARAVVLLASFGGFSMLLTADAEAEAVPLRPGPIDVLKVAHHGSEDQGLGDLLDRSAPRLAVIPVGAGNPYGHPTPQTLSELAAHDVPVLRTDLHGPVQIEVGAGRWAVLPGVE